MKPGTERDTRRDGCVPSGKIKRERLQRLSHKLFTLILREFYSKEELLVKLWTRQVC